ncbi:hypothetical protein CSOJ01_01375 [Colletotrichum sojae]|uniref:Uncharacterized protein n=1 Tax=Colletotrichum sojae TaxID=2175907 RepID=A0A8H6N4I8_9PEZI|nr:hypothetical protein CSOJ01_01375 [Colletotrichum sojae]
MAPRIWDGTPAAGNAAAGGTTLALADSDDASISGETLTAAEHDGTKAQRCHAFPPTEARKKRSVTGWAANLVEGDSEIIHWDVACWPEELSDSTGGRLPSPFWLLRNTHSTHTVLLLLATLPNTLSLSLFCSEDGSNGGKLEANTNGQVANGRRVDPFSAHFAASFLALLLSLL